MVGCSWGPIQWRWAGINPHFVSPASLCPPSLDLSELAKAAKKKLQAVSGGRAGLRGSHPLPPSCLMPSPIPLQLSNRLFEELAMDVYDEVDRRENDAGERGARGAAPQGWGWVGSRRGEEQPAGPWLSPELPPNLDPCLLGPQAPPSSFLWPRSFSRREGPPLGTGAGVLLEVGAGTPQGQGLSPEGCPWAGG